MTNTGDAGKANLFDWNLFLRQYSQDLLERLEDSEFASLPSEVIETRWLGYPKAAEAEIANAQTRLETIFPPSYRNFLAVTDGWLKLDDYPYQPVNLRNNENNFLFIGRLLKEKGIFDFIEAAKIVKQQYPKTKFTVLGNIDADNPGALHADQVQELVATGLIDFPGQVANVVDWIGNSDVFVLPSYREGVPRSTQEAMAIGRAIITTDVPGCRETVVDGLNGFLVPKWDPEALAKKMIYFIEHPEQARLMGAESYKIAVEKFDAEKVNQRLVNILGL